MFVSRGCVWASQGGVKVGAGQYAACSELNLRDELLAHAIGEGWSRGWARGVSLGDLERP